MPLLYLTYQFQLNLLYQNSYIGCIAAQRFTTDNFILLKVALIKMFISSKLFV